MRVLIVYDGSVERAAEVHKLRQELFIKNNSSDIAAFNTVWLL